MKLQRVHDRQFKRVVDDFKPTPAKKLSRNKRGSNQYRLIRKDAATSTYTIRESNIRLTIAFMYLGFLGIAWFNSFWASLFIISPLPRERIIEQVHAEEPQEAYSDLIGEELDLFIKRVRQLESSNGTNPNPNALHNYCASIGKRNWVGYGGMAGIDGELYCFDDEEHEYRRLAIWYREQRETLNEAQTYCKYNLGLAIEGCEYFEKARSL
jgi:hypothetical protein